MRADFWHGRHQNKQKKKDLKETETTNRKEKFEKPIVCIFRKLREGIYICETRIRS